MENDDRIRIGAVITVAVIAAVISYLHIRHLALAHGNDPWGAALLPLCVDTVIVVATTSMIRTDSRLWMWWARILLLLACSATLAANMAYGAQWGRAGMVIWAWPAVAFFGCAELAIGMARKGQAGPGTGQESAGPRARDASVPGARPAPASVPDALTDQRARHDWLESGRTLTDRKLAGMHGRSRTYWTARIRDWQATA